jgi:tryptophanyl-tRNA synthetase
MLRPVQARFRELAGDPAETTAVLRRGAEKAGTVAAATLTRAKDAIGLLAPD